MRHPKKGGEAIDKETAKLAERNRIEEMSPAERQAEFQKQLAEQQRNAADGGQDPAHDAEVRRKIEELKHEVAQAERLTGNITPAHHAAVARALGNQAIGGILLGHGTADEREMTLNTRRAADHLARIDAKIHTPPQGRSPHREALP